MKIVARGGGTSDIPWFCPGKRWAHVQAPRNTQRCTLPARPCPRSQQEAYGIAVLLEPLGTISCITSQDDQLVKWQDDIVIEDADLHIWAGKLIECVKAKTCVFN